MSAMNTTNAVTAAVENVYEIPAIQLIRLAASDDLDATEFVSRYVRYLSLVTMQRQRTEAEQAEMERMLGAIVNSYTNDAFREHLQKVLRGE
jgi:hypothetical protein